MIDFIKENFCGKIEVTANLLFLISDMILILTD